jgi:hypothetical protein
MGRVGMKGGGELSEGEKVKEKVKVKVQGKKKEKNVVVKVKEGEEYALNWVSTGRILY